MSTKTRDDVIEIRDPDIDPEQIMEQIRKRIQQRREELGYEERSFPVFGKAAYPSEPEDSEYDIDLYHHLRLANERYTDVETQATLAPSPATSLPVIGRLWRLIRREVHNLVLFYVNRHVTHQTMVNRHLISVLNRLTTAYQQQEERIQRLEAELESLRKQR